MAWEIIKKFTLNGEKVKMWQGKDPEGRRIYDVAPEDNLYVPDNGLYSQKAAIEAYQHYKKMYVDLKNAGDI